MVGAIYRWSTGLAVLMHSESFSRRVGWVTPTPHLLVFLLISVQNLPQPVLALPSIQVASARLTQRHGSGLEGAVQEPLLARAWPPRLSTSYLYH